MIAYIEPQLDSLDPDIQDFATAQKWSALAYKNPHEAARTIATSLAQLNQNDTTEWIRIATLLEALEEPLIEYRSLITYAQAIADFSRGNLENAIHLLNQILTSTNQLQIAQVDLPIPEVLKARLAALQVSESQQSRPKIEFPQQYRWLINGGIAGSLALASGVFYLSQENRSPQPTPSVVSAAPSQVTQSVTPSPQPSATPSITPELPLNSTPSPSPTSRSTAESTPASSPTIPLPSPSTTAMPQLTASPNSSTDVLSSQPTNQPESLQSLPTLNSPDTNLLPPPPLPGERIFPAPVANSSAGLNTPSTENTPLRSENKPLRSAIGLRVGNMGSMVEELQRLLRNLGYFDAPITGYFGLITQDAVIRLQRDRGLPETGIVDSSTLSPIGSSGGSPENRYYYVLVPKKDGNYSGKI